MTAETINRLASIEDQIRKPVVTEVALVLFGVSFSIWAIYIGMFSTPRWLAPWYLPYMVWLTVCFTIAGLFAVGYSLEKMHSPRRLTAIASLCAFVFVNLVGFVFYLYFLFEQAGRGIFGLSWSLYPALYEQTAIFMGFVALFGLVLFPFLEKTARWALIIPSFLAAIYLAVVVARNLSIFTGSVGIALPGSTVPPMVQLFSPTFGIPGALLSNGLDNTPSHIAVLLATGSNASYAFLYFLGAWRISSRVNGVQL